MRDGELKVFSGSAHPELAAAICQLQTIGLDQVASHENGLTAYALEKLAGIPGIQIYGDRDPERASQRLGVIPMGLQAVTHFLAASVLGYEFGIGVRSGCFCAHPYILHLLGLTPEQARKVRQTMLSGDKRNMPGLIRASFGIYNSCAEVDALVEALGHIQKGDYQGRYVQEKASGEYKPEAWSPQFDSYFSFI